MKLVYNGMDVSIYIYIIYIYIYAICTKCEYHVHSSLSHSDVWVQAPPFCPIRGKEPRALERFPACMVAEPHTSRVREGQIRQKGLLPVRDLAVGTSVLAC